MTMADAAHMIAIRDGKDRIMQDPSLTIFGKVKAIESINRAAQAAPQPQPFLTPSQVVHGAVGAGLGLGVGRIVGRFLGVSPETQSTLDKAGMGLGALLNAGAIRSNHMKTGHDKTAQEAKVAEVDQRDRRNAVKLGFLLGARETGLIDRKDWCQGGMPKSAGYVAAGAMRKHAVALAVTPDTITAPVRAAAGTVSGTATGAGNIAAHIMGEDETDEDIQKMMLEKRMLEIEADRLNAQRRNRILQRVLSRRVQAYAPQRAY